MVHKRGYALKEYIHLDFFYVRYEICVLRDLPWRHFEPVGRYWVVDDPVEGMLLIVDAVAC
jgi:hypothetical protein